MAEVQKSDAGPWYVLYFLLIRICNFLKSIQVFKYSVQVLLSLLNIGVGHRAAGNSTFRKLWRQLTPNIVIGKPMTDLCWVCQKNNNAIYRSSNLPDCVKSAKLRKQEQHLSIVGTERQAYQDMIASCRATVGMLGVKLGPNPPCSQDLTIHYSFDYAQQVCFITTIMFQRTYRVNCCQCHVLRL